MKGFIQVHLVDADDEDNVQEVFLNVSSIKAVCREGMNGCTLWLDSAVQDGVSESACLYTDETFEVVVGRLSEAVL